MVASLREPARSGRVVFGPNALPHCGAGLRRLGMGRDSCYWRARSAAFVRVLGRYHSGLAVSRMRRSSIRCWSRLTGRTLGTRWQVRLRAMSPLEESCCCAALKMRACSPPALELRSTGEMQERTYFVADESGFAQVVGSWVPMDAAQSDVVANAYPTPDTRKGSLPLAVRVNHGKGTVVVCPGPIASAYGNGSTPIIRSDSTPDGGTVACTDDKAGRRLSCARNRAAKEGGPDAHPSDQFGRRTGHRRVPP